MKSKNKFEHHHQIQHIRIILCTNFYFKQPMFMFRTKFSQEKYFEFSIFELV